MLPAPSHPWYVAGTERFCTEIMQRFGTRTFVKMGAEGVYCGAFPDAGLGFAVKCDDGAGSLAAEVILAALIVRFLPSSVTVTALYGALDGLFGRNSRIGTAF